MVDAGKHMTEVMNTTYALLDRSTVLDALCCLEENRDEATLQALISLVHNPGGARVAVRALQILSKWEHPLVRDAILAGLQESRVTIQFAALQALKPKLSEELSFAVVPILKHSTNWSLRRAALEKLAETPEPIRDEILTAISDPSWRVRYALMEILRMRGMNASAEQDSILRRLFEDESQARAAGLGRCLRWYWHQTPPSATRGAGGSSSGEWSPDLALASEQILTAELSSNAIQYLMEMSDPRIHRALTARLRRTSAAEKEELPLAVDSRLPGFAVLNELGLVKPTVSESGPYFQAQQISEGTIPITADSAAAWVGHNFAIVRAAVARRLLEMGEKIHLRALQEDRHPSVRTAALDAERAKDIIDGRICEKSWEVICRAAILAKTPLWKIEPQPKWPIPARSSAPFAEPVFKQAASARELGTKHSTVAPLAISGQYSLEQKGFSRAIESGINLFFWEPGYTTLTEFASGLKGSVQQKLHFIAGSFEADPKRVRADVERALRNLQIEQISFFMIFWVADWRRLSDELINELQQLQSEGKIGTCGLSTHDRELALRAIKEGWDPIMIRHSAAHPGAEKEVFPAAAEAGTSIIAFNCTCYGRLLAENSITAADCYRYSLSKNPVRICLSGPSSLQELEQNLDVIRQPELQRDKLEVLLQAGKKVYANDKVFTSCIRHV